MPFQLKSEHTKAANTLRAVLTADAIQLANTLSEALFADRISTANECLDDAVTRATYMRDHLNDFISAAAPKAHAEAAE